MCRIVEDYHTQSGEFLWRVHIEPTWRDATAQTERGLQISSNLYGLVEWTSPSNLRSYVHRYTASKFICIIVYE